jgi:hypothetical protein
MRKIGSDTIRAEATYSPNIDCPGKELEIWKSNEKTAKDINRKSDIK